MSPRWDGWKVRSIQVRPNGNGSETVGTPNVPV